METHLVTQLIKSEETYPLRHQMRPLRAMEDQGNAEDHEPETFHIGAFIGERLVGIASFNAEAHKEFSALRPYRLRGMASDQEYQGQGIGRETLLAGVQELQNRGCDLLWCNAREKAFPFYEKMGLLLHGPMFDIPTIGPHKVMYKRL